MGLQTHKSITIISQKLNQFSSPWSSYTMQLEKPSVTVEYKCEALLQPSNTRISMKLRLLKDSSPTNTRSRRDLRPREGGDTRRQLPQVLDQRQALPRRERGARRGGPHHQAFATHRQQEPLRVRRETRDELYKNRSSRKTDSQ